MIDKLCCAQCGHLLVEKTSERFTFVAAELVRIAWEIFSSVACALHRAGVFGSLHNRFSETSRNFARSSFSLFVASSNAVISFIVFLLVVLQHRSCQREACAAPCWIPPAAGAASASSLVRQLQRMAVTSPVRGAFELSRHPHDQGDFALPWTHRPTLRGLDARLRNNLEIT